MRTLIHALHLRLLAVAIALAAVGCGLLSGAAHAQSRRGPALSWLRLPGADGCIAPAELSNRVEERLGKHVFTSIDDAIVVIEGRVKPAPNGGFSVVMRVTDQQGRLFGTRELTSPSPDCSALDDVTALVIAIVIRRDGASGITLPMAIAAELDALFAPEPASIEASTPTEPAAQAPPPIAAEPVAPPPSIPRPPPAAWHFGFELAVGFATGIQPSLASVAALRALVQHDAMVVASLSALFSYPQRQTGIDGDGQLAQRCYGFGLALCLPLLRRGSSELGLCAEGRVGELLITPSGFDAQRPDRGLWVELAPRVTLRVHALRPAYLLVGLALPIRLQAPEFRFTDRRGDTQVALAPTLLGLEGELGVGVEF